MPAFAAHVRTIEHARNTVTMNRLSSEAQSESWLLQARFAKHVFPGETLVTDMWRVSDNRIVFRVTVEGRGDVAISNAAVVLRTCERAPVESKL